VGKVEVMRSYREPAKAAIDGSRHDEDRIQVHGDLAVVSSRITVTGRAADQSFTRYYRVTYVLRKDEGRWQVANSHASLLAP
jgi:ketosteroid isomerase-like protein